MAHIYHLPDELLLEIGRHFGGRYRNTDLRSLALASRRLRPVAQEQLLSEPAFHLSRIHHYLWELAHHPWFFPKIRTLEIWSQSKGGWTKEELETRLTSSAQPTPPTMYPAMRSRQGLEDRIDFRDKCATIVSLFAKSRRHKQEWIIALSEDIISGLFGVLLVSLPNLKELRLAAAWILDFPVFSALKARGISRVYPKPWNQKYQVDVLDPILQKLEVLEFPTHLKHLYSRPHPHAVFDFRAFSRLKQFSLPMGALCCCATRAGFPTDPLSFLPQSLELLRISEATEMTVNFINNVCIEKKRFFFPVLRRVELYFYTHRIVIATAAAVNLCPHPVDDTRKMCLDAGLELFLYFPSEYVTTMNAGRPLWSLREEGVLADVEDELWKVRRVTSGANTPGVPEWRPRSWELGIDAGGDVEMTLW